MVWTKEDKRALVDKSPQTPPVGRGTAVRRPKESPSKHGWRGVGELLPWPWGNTTARLVLKPGPKEKENTKYTTIC